MNSSQQSASFVKATIVITLGIGLVPKIARAHHFVPRFLLANFSPLGTREDQLWVSDLRTERQWPTISANCGHSRDFYRVEGRSPEAVEKLLSGIEDRAAPIIREVIETRALPEHPDSRDALLYFIALLATRIPAVRNTIDGFMGQVGQHLLELSVETPERWDALTLRMKESGYSSAEDISYERARQIIMCRDVEIKASTNWQLGMMLDGAASIFPTLKARTWCILISSSGNLISSDRPVSIVFTVAAPPFLSPGFGLNHTEVTVPLSRHVLLRGVWKKQPRDPVQMTRRWVGHYNTLRAIQATRFLFSPTENFPWTDGKRSVRLGLQGMNEFFGSQSEDPVNGDFLGQ